MNETRRELDLKFNYLGESEYLLASSKAETKDVNSIAALIEEHRKPFTEGRVSSIGSAAFASVGTWKAISADSERAARAELLAFSPELAQLTELEAKALAARNAADAKERELQALWSEFQALPVKAEKLNDRLNTIATQLRDLDQEKLSNDFTTLYRSTQEGVSADQFALTNLAGIIATRELRVEVLEKMAGELQAELEGLRKRNRQLSKVLGRKQEI